MNGIQFVASEHARALEHSIDVLEKALGVLRGVAHDLMPEALVRFGLDVALKDICDDINASGALKVEYRGMGLADQQLDATTSITIYRIVQELLNNTMKHASARHASVQVIRQGGRVAVTVEDDGKGFDTGILKGARGIGWSNIAHRVAFLKGHWDVESMPGKGTSVHIEITV